MLGTKVPSIVLTYRFCVEIKLFSPKAIARPLEYKVDSTGGYSLFLPETKNKNNPKNPVDPVKKKLHESYCSKNGHVPDMLRFPVRIEDAGKWKESLKLSEKSGLGIMPTYPDSINGIPELKEALKGQSCPIAKKLAYQLVTFPIHPYVVPKDIKKITKLFLKEIRNGNN